MMEWRYIPYRKYSAAWNMAIDEAMMIAHQEQRVPPTLRFYGWEPAALSIGYFQKVEKEVDRAELARQGLELVRRLTGGRAVLHDQELTYSIVVSEKDPILPPSVSASYRALSQGLVAGFRILGLQAELAPPQSTASLGTAACFDTSSDYELVLEGKKVAGSAQVRKQGVVLQHGSILLEVDLERLMAVLRFPSERVKERLKESFAQKAVAINQMAARKVTLEEMISAFYQGFTTGLSIKLVEGELTPYEWKLAEQLVQSKYQQDDWNLQR